MRPACGDLRFSRGIRPANSFDAHLLGSLFQGPLGTDHHVAREPWVLVTHVPVREAAPIAAAVNGRGDEAITTKVKAQGVGDPAPGAPAAEVNGPATALETVK